MLHFSTYGVYHKTLSTVCVMYMVIVSVVTVNMQHISRKPITIECVLTRSVCTTTSAESHDRSENISINDDTSGMREKRVNIKVSSD
jgi:hypothetical protein